MLDLVARGDVLDALIEKGQNSKRYKWGESWELNLTEIKEAVESVPSTEPERKKGRKFLGIVVNYPKICTYPEYEGKPYYSIKYEENGDMIIGFGTYKPEVLSHFLREYFISSAEPERKNGEWIKVGHWGRTYKCNQCGNYLDFDGVNAGRGDANFCPNCGAKMEETK